MQSFSDSDYGVAVGKYLIKPDSFMDAAWLIVAAGLILGAYVNSKNRRLVDEIRESRRSFSYEEIMIAMRSPIVTSGVAMLASGVLVVAVIIEGVVAIVFTGDVSTDAVFDFLILLFIVLSAVLISVIHSYRIIKCINRVVKTQQTY